MRQSYYFNLRNYNKERRRCARVFKRNLVSKLDDLRVNNPSEYWKLLKRFNDQPCESDSISMAEWSSYFKKLNNPNVNDNVRRSNLLNELNEMEKHEYFNEMDFEVTEREILLCILIENLATIKQLGKILFATR